MLVNPVIQRKRQKNFEFEARLGYKVKTYLKTNKQGNKETLGKKNCLACTSPGFKPQNCKQTNKQTKKTQPIQRQNERKKKNLKHTKF
jgi:hypothetical protein